MKEVYYYNQISRVSQDYPFVALMREEIVSMDGSNLFCLAGQKRSKRQATQPSDFTQSIFP